MSFQEFILGFETLISGFAAARFFQGWGEMIKYRRKFRYYWAHLLTTLVAFFILIQYWWGSFYRDTDSQVSTIWEFMFLLSVPATFYFMAIQLYPTYRGQSVDLRVYFQRNLRAYAGYLFTYYALQTFRHLYYDLPMFDDRGITRAVGMTLSALLFVTNSRRLAEWVVVVAGIIILWFFTFVEPA